MVKTAKQKRAAAARAAAKARTDNRPWFDRATEGQFWTPPKGSSTVLITGEPSERISNFGKPVVDIPTSQGVLSTGAFDVLRPLAVFFKKHGKLTGKRLSFIAVGEKQARRYTEVQLLP